MHAVLLAIGVLAIALAAEMIFTGTAPLWPVGVLATSALLADADLFSFVMTESVTFSIYSLAALSIMWALKHPGFRKVLLVGGLFGLLTLTRPSYVVLALVVPVLLAGFFRRIGMRRRMIARHLAAFAFGWLVVVGPWLARNAISFGHWGLTEEYGSAALIERIAYNDMTAQEILLSFPYCLPRVGPPLVEQVFGAAAMERFVYYAPRSFFHAGRGHRDDLVDAYGRLDPIIGPILKEEMSRNWWRHLLVSLPLGWCGMWVGGWLGLALVPLFVGACLAAGPSTRLPFLIYSAPAVVMLGLHAVVANQYTRYNLILIGPFSVGAVWLIHRLMRQLSARSTATI